MWKWLRGGERPETAGGGRGKGSAGRRARLSRQVRPIHRPFLQSVGAGRAPRSSLRAKRPAQRPAARAAEWSPSGPVSFAYQCAIRVYVPGRSPDPARKAAPVCGSGEGTVCEVGLARGPGYRRWHAGPVMVAMFNSGRGRGIWGRPGSGGAPAVVSRSGPVRPVRTQPIEEQPPDPHPLRPDTHRRHPASPGGRRTDAAAPCEPRTPSGAPPRYRPVHRRGEPPAAAPACPPVASPRPSPACLLSARSAGRAVSGPVGRTPPAARPPRRRVRGRNAPMRRPACRPPVRPSRTPGVAR